MEDFDDIRIRKTPIKTENVVHEKKVNNKKVNAKVRFELPDVPNDSDTDNDASEISSVTDSQQSEDDYEKTFKNNNYFSIQGVNLVGFIYPDYKQSHCPFCKLLLLKPCVGCADTKDPICKVEKYEDNFYHKHCSVILENTAKILKADPTSKPENDNGNASEVDSEED